MQCIKMENDQCALEGHHHQALTWFQGICSGINYIQGNNIIYRDIKPSNILFGRADAASRLATLDWPSTVQIAYDLVA